MKLKYPNLRISVPPSKKFQLAYLYLSGSIHKICFNMRYPVVASQIAMQAQAWSLLRYIRQMKALAAEYIAHYVGRAVGISKILVGTSLLLGSYYTYWSYKCFDPYFLDQPVRTFVNGGTSLNVPIRSGGPEQHHMACTYHVCPVCIACILLIM